MVIDIKGSSNEFKTTSSEIGTKEKIVLNLEGKSLIINKQKEEKHIPGSKNFIQGRSIITISMEKIQKIINEKSGTGQAKSEHTELIDCEEEIGFYVNPITNEKYPTTMGIIQYGKTGSHLIPARPKNYKER